MAAFLPLGVFCLARVEAVEAERVFVYVGVEKQVTDFLPPHRRVVPTPEQPAYYAAEHVSAAGAPPAWMAEWVARDFAASGYVLAGERAPWRLVFEWRAVDPDISHIGRPLQSVAPRGRTVFSARETKQRRAWQMGEPFCVVTAYDQSATASLAARVQPLWRARSSGPC